jgi:hypothetical protein
MLFFIGTALIVGTRALWRMPGGDMSAVALTLLLYIIMHFIFAYVDISWDTQSMVLLGTAIGLLNALEDIVSRPEPQKRTRWPWQMDPAPAPALRPFPDSKPASG